MSTFRTTLFLLSLCLGTQALGAEIAVTAPCTKSEHWVYPKGLGASTESFDSFLKGKTSAVVNFANALALRRFSPADNLEEGRAMAEYFISRSLLEAGLVHIAVNGFGVIAGRPINTEAPGLATIQLAALGCLAEIHKAHSSITLPSGAAANIDSIAGSIAKTAPNKEILADLALIRSNELLAEPLPSQSAGRSDLERKLALLSPGSIHDNLVRGFYAAKRNQHKESVEFFKKFLTQATNASGTQAWLKRYVDTVQILLGRAYYSTGQFDKAGQHLRAIERKSNELAESLSELSWAYLMADRYSEAIGTAINLQSGGLRHTFTPEAPMVMAIAMNELCQYPDSVKAVAVFRKHYESAYLWLSKWNKQGAKPSFDSRSLYELAVEFLKQKAQKPGDKNAVPVKIASEWVRSSLFIATQEEINLHFDEKDAASRLNSLGAQEQRRIAQEIVKLSGELKGKIRDTRKKIGPDEALPKELLSELEVLRNRLLLFHRMQAAAPVWKSIFGASQKLATTTISKLTSRINNDLKNRTLRMHEQLEEIAENIELIEVEIYNGATHDIIWQNAHPDYKQVAQKLNKDRDNKDASGVWNWGRSSADTEEGGEVWEDELGSFKANVFDNCSNKEKYLAIKNVGKNTGSSKGNR